MSDSPIGRDRLEPEVLASVYMTLKERVIDAGYAAEIDWQEGVVFDEWDETTFLREAAWVVLSSGFRERVIRRCFPGISAAFLQWTSARAIVQRHETCRTNALLAFANHRKIDAILRIADRVDQEGIDAIRAGIQDRGLDFIQGFPFMGPITACHLAKNLGVSIAKPDRHLSRMAVGTGHSSVQQMCCTIKDIVGDAVQVIDVVIWRYATISGNSNRDFWND